MILPSEKAVTVCPNLWLNIGIDPPSTMWAWIHSITLKGIKRAKKSLKRYSSEILVFVDLKLWLIGIRIKMCGIHELGPSAGQRWWVWTKRTAGYVWPERRRRTQRIPRFARTYWTPGKDKSIVHLLHIHTHACARAHTHVDPLAHSLTHDNEITLNAA